MYIESFLTNLLLRIMGTLHGQQSHLPVWSATLNIMQLMQSRIFAKKFRNKHPQESTKQALNSLEEATEANMVDVLPETHI